MGIGTPTSIGSDSFTGATPGLQINLSAAITAGNLVVVAIGIWNGTAAATTVTAVSDGTNTYTRATSSSGAATNVTIELWYVANAVHVAGSGQINVTLNTTTGSGGAQQCVAIQVSGVKATSPLDGHTASGASGVSTLSETLSSLISANEISFGAAWQAATGTAYISASGYTNLFNLNANSGTLSLDYLLLGASTNTTYSPTFTGSAFVDAAAASFLPAAVAAGFNMPMLGF